MTRLSRWISGLKVVPIMHLDLATHTPPTCVFLAYSLFKLGPLPSVPVMSSATSWRTIYHVILRASALKLQVPDHLMNMPRRAWQRRNILRAAANTSPVARSKAKLQKQAFNAHREGRSAGLLQEWPGEDSSFSCGSDSESDGDYRERRPAARRIVPADGVHKVRDIPSNISECLKLESDSDSDSDIDSGYASLEDPDETADFYDDLLERFREEGPTLANHGDNTKKMIQEQEQKWREYGPVDSMCLNETKLSSSTGSANTESSTRWRRLANVTSRYSRYTWFGG
jgi:hypothetical protein